jgi:hypothetical protein
MAICWQLRFTSLNSEQIGLKLRRKRKLKDNLTGEYEETDSLIYSAGNGNVLSSFYKNGDFFFLPKMWQCRKWSVYV